MIDASSKIDAGKTMGEMWDGFAAAVLPLTSPESVKGREMKKAFFAGGLCLFTWFMVQPDEGSEPAEGDLDTVTAMDKEIRAFLESQGVIGNIR